MKAKKKVSAKPARKSAPKAKKKAKPTKKAKPKAKKPAPKAKKKAKPTKKAKPKAKRNTIKKVEHTKVVSKKEKLHKVISRPVVHSKAKHRVADNRTRYSDKELEEFRQLILEKLEAAKHELKYLQEQISRSADNGTDDTENKFASMDDGSSTMEREYLNQMAARQRMYLDHLGKALIRIQNKTYGICRVTGKLIEKDRLRAVPHATLSMEAKLTQHHNTPANV